jgi:CheY-like chemotaxis protein
VINGAEAIGEVRVGAVHVRTSIVNVDDEYLRQQDFPQGQVKPGECVLLEVQDNGCGMDEETKAKIFDPFFTTKFTGRGLGLAAALGIVRGHKGAVRVTSTPGAGSTFQVLFPVPTVVNAQPSAELAYNAVEFPGNPTVLVVDDEEIVRNTAKLTLQRYGCVVLLAENGQDAVDLFQVLHDQISLVLLDLTMPVMSGEETLHRLHAIRPDVPVILSSGYNQKDVIDRFQTKGLAGFIQKPYTAAELADKMKAVLV